VLDHSRTLSGEFFKYSSKEKNQYNDESSRFFYEYEAKAKEHIGNDSRPLRVAHGNVVLLRNGWIPLSHHPAARHGDWRFLGKSTRMTKTPWLSASTSGFSQTKKKVFA
jgi:hypothetical protein